MSRPLWVVLGLTAGALLSVQSRMNGELSRRFGHGLDAALWSFGSGLLVLTVALALSSPMRAGLSHLRMALRENRIRWWQCLGGLLGGLFVFCQSYAVPLAGVALYTIAVVGGQTASGVLVDRLGIGPGGRRPVTLGRVGAAVLASIGIAVAVGGRVTGSGASVVVPVVLSALTGVGLAVQQGTNGRVGVASGNAFTTTWLNFGLGAVLLVVLTVPASRVGQLASPASLDAPWWAWCGGVVGIGAVAIGSAGVRHLGVLLLLLLMLVGQLSAALVIDTVDPATRGQVSLVTILGLLLTLAAALLAGVAAGRSQRRGLEVTRT